MLSMKAVLDLSPEIRAAWEEWCSGTLSIEDGDHELSAEGLKESLAFAFYWGFKAGADWERSKGEAMPSLEG